MEYWDDLMSRVNYIEDLQDQKYGRFIVTIVGDECTVESSRKNKSSYQAFKHIGKTKYEAVTNATNEFLDWYKHLNK